MVERDEQLSQPRRHPSGTDSESGPTSTGRRRLLKGLGLTLPAVATLYHGAVLANASSVLCLQSQNRPGNPIVGQNQLRTSNCPSSVYETGSSPVSVLTYTKSGSPDRSFYYDSYTSYLQSSPLWREVVGGSDLIDGSIYNTQAALDAHMTSLGYGLASSSNTFYAVSYIDDNGNIVSQGPIQGAPRALPATCSCWTSLATPV